MNDLKTFLDAVLEMRAAQILELDALPGNLKIWKRARQPQNVARLEDKVDTLVQEILQMLDATNVQEPETHNAKGNG